LGEAGFALGAGAGFLLGSAIGGGAIALAGIGGVMGGLNGMLSGMHGIYDWEHPGGWFAFLSDSTWGLLGTSLGNIVQVMNMVSGAKYRDDLSRRQNRNVYEGGFYIMKDDAFTQGNVISNAGLGGKGVDMNLIDNHESIHILQNRIFGPLFQVVYVVWLVGGFIVGSVFWLFHTDHKWGDIVETAAYFDRSASAATRAMRWPGRCCSRSAGLSMKSVLPSVTETIRLPATVSWRPRATVSTSGSSGITCSNHASTSNQEYSLLRIAKEFRYIFW